MPKARVAVTAGDPAGIGPEIALRAALDESIADIDVAVFGPRVHIERVRDRFSIPVEVVDWAAEPEGHRQGVLKVVDICRPENCEISLGEVSRLGGEVALRSFEAAVHATRQGKFDAVCTGPWNKAAVQLTGARFSGHTEYLAHLMDVDPDAVSMMLVHDTLRVFHVSTHVRLREVVELATSDRIQDVIALADGTLRRLGIARPRIAVAALNPHAGEDGLFGDEDLKQVTPAVAAAGAEGIDVQGPIPGDTVFVRALRGEFDGVVAMYHDQGHIPIKVAGMGHAVNVTVGTPLIRTSVDHGTAMDIAAEGVAEPDSLVQAIAFAADMVAT
ncbi:MAG TPA: 4-hydroxythreonine-4-phosphate dehydrogenase PdxA [Solirubrobacterales bacterium]|nr:4-hydroxythreonine-4-phosphate dehydrogenase PdxA [Solirubrobacterales bacterium]